MVNFIIRKIIGSKNQREIRRMMPIVRKINELEEQYQSLSDDDLRAKTAGWKARLSAIEDYQEQQKALDEILPEAFAVVKNTARRLCGQEHIVWPAAARTWSPSTITWPAATRSGSARFTDFSD